MPKRTDRQRRARSAARSRAAKQALAAAVRAVEARRKAASRASSKRRKPAPRPKAPKPKAPKAPKLAPPRPGQNPWQPPPQVAPQAKPRTTRATKLHREQRQRTLSIEEQLLGKIRASKSKTNRKNLRAMLKELRAFQAQLKASPRTAVPVGAVVGSPVVTFAEPQSMRSYVETRFFSSGPKMLGFLTGRPGITELLGMQAATPPQGAQPLPTPVLDPFSQALIDALPFVQAADPKDQAKVKAFVLQAWIAAELGGVEIMVEVEYESTES